MGESIPARVIAQRKVAYIHASGSSLSEDHPDFKKNRKIPYEGGPIPDKTTRKEVLKAIERHQAEAQKIALRLIEREARKLMKRHPVLKEYIQANGVSHFIVREDFPELGCLKTFNDMVEALDYTWNILGNPMRFTATGKVITEW